MDNQILKAVPDVVKSNGDQVVISITGIDKGDIYIKDKSSEYINAFIDGYDVYVSSVIDIDGVIVISANGYDDLIIPVYIRPVQSNLIIVNPVEFRERFPELKNATDKQIQIAYWGSSAYISVSKNSISLDPLLQEIGVYLATAHNVYMQQNPDAFRQVSSASQDGVSAGFTSLPVKSSLEYYLSLTPYGLQLLSILNQIQPLIPGKINLPGYYNY